MKVALVLADTPDGGFSIDMETVEGDEDAPATPAVLAAATLYEAAVTGLAANLFPMLLPVLAAALAGQESADVVAFATALPARDLRASTDTPDDQKGRNAPACAREAARAS